MCWTILNITLERNGLERRIALDPVDGLVEITDNDGSYTHCYCCLTIVSHTTQRTHSFNSLIYSHFFSVYYYRRGRRDSISREPWTADKNSRELQSRSSAGTQPQSQKDVDTSLMQLAGIELGPNRYDATLQTSTLCYTIVRARGRSRRGTLSKMASFIDDSCRDQRFSLETWDGSKNDRLGSMHTSDYRRSVWYKN